METTTAAPSSLTIPTTTTPQTKKKSKSFMASLLVTSPTSSTSSPSFKDDSSPNHHPRRLKSLSDLKTALSASPHISSASTIWGVPLLAPSPALDVVLLKFLQARDFHVPDALSMLERCLEWRKEFGADSILAEDLSSDFMDLEGVVAYMSGFDRQGHPVCYNAYGVFHDRKLYERVFGDEEKLRKFLRWRVQVLERGVALLHFKPGGVNSIIQVTDLKDMPKRELRVVSAQILSLFQDNYPEMVARKIFINVPWYFSALYAMFSPFLTQRTKSKFVISREGYAADTLYKFIRPEDIPVLYGGLSRPSDLQSGPPKPASEFTVKGGEKVHIQIEGIEANSTITWDLVVGGWDLEYSAEFVPDAEGSYTIAVEKPRRMSLADEAVHNSYTSHESGKMVISVDNSVSRRKKVAAYRYIVRKHTVASC